MTANEGSLPKYSRVPLSLLLLLLPAFAADPVQFTSPGHTDLGEWSVAATVGPAAWQPGDTLSVSAVVTLNDSHLAAFAAATKAQPDGFVMLLTTERTFDADGWIRLGSDERMSTLVTPTGLGIEGGVQGAITSRFGYRHRTPVDVLVRVPVSAAAHANSQRAVTFQNDAALPTDLPPGIYRVRLDFGFTSNGRYYSLNGEQFAYRPFFNGQPTESHVYSPPLRASGRHATGRVVDASQIQPRLPWIVLAAYNSNGYAGVVADEDRPRFALSNRNIIPDDVILPLYDANGRKASYNLEPQFPTDTIELRSNIPWDYTKGEYSVVINAPDGSVTDLGTSPWVGANGQWPTTRKRTITAWQPPAYGFYTVNTKGWLADIWGNRYEGGGTYHFWIANRMTMATATFQGMPYPVGNRYGRDMAFNPPLPADVDFTATLFPNSDRTQATTVHYTGKANSAGIYGSVQGMQPLPFTAAGEYTAHILARAVDARGNLWVSSMRHAGVVYPPDTPIVARGKKVTVGNNYLDQGETNLEGYVAADGTQHLQHINFPFNAGDVLLIAAEGQGANKIEPVLTWDYANNPQPYASRLQTIGISNVQMETSNGLSPHMFPEYITTWAYYYGGAPRPGFMARFLVAEDGTRAPYWPTTNTNVGGQINASVNGDTAGDIYRLIGGVVLRKPGQTPLYAGYVASAFMLPPGSNNNRVIAPGAEDVLGPAGLTGRVFLVGTRPGMMYDAGTTFAPAVQIDPILPVTVLFTLEYPDGRTHSWQGTGDATGSFAGADRVTLDTPGIYRFHLTADWNGFRGVMPGLPADGGFLYVIDTNKPAGTPELKFNLPVESYFTPAVGLNITGTSTADSVYYAAIIPGAVIDQGVLPVTGGKFAYFWDPKLANQKSQTYDVTNLRTRAPALADVVHLTFFARERGADGKPYYSFQRIVLRGNKAICTK